MKPDLLFLSVEDVLALHQIAIERFGGTAGLRDHSLLESAIAAPQASFDGIYLNSDLFEMAAAYAYHIAQNQAFLDGNKRTGLLAALVFLDINGLSFDEPCSDLYECIIGFSSGEKHKSDLAGLFRRLADQSKLAK